VKIENVMMSQDNFIHTITFSEQEEGKETFVLVHGYGASGLIFYPILKELSRHFHLITIDMLGMGASARPKFTANDVESSENFFTESIEEWRINYGLN
jgi:pimeloyl-ACP methyl ester carboxylesterase